MLNTEEKRGPRFVRYFQPVIDALKALGGSDLPPLFGPLLMLNSLTETGLGPPSTLPEPEVCNQPNCAV